MNKSYDLKPSFLHFAMYLLLCDPMDNSPSSPSVIVKQTKMFGNMATSKRNSQT